MAKLWKVRSPIPAELSHIYKEYHPLVAQILYNRGVTDPSEFNGFFDPSYDRLHSPFLFSQMQKAVDRVWQAIENKEQIWIYGDYDADAVTANAVLQQTFRYLGVAAKSYIPDRFSEGYGLNVPAFEHLKSEGAQLVITVDCGTNSGDCADYCKQNNIDLIITDHHEITGAIPDAFALVNPKNPEEVYPDHQITGVGVAYKLAQAILQQKEKVIRQKQITEDQYVAWDKWLLDLVSIGTVADCHSLLGENRILVTLGLKVMAKTRWPGLRLLLDQVGVDCREKFPDTYTIGFTLAPRINAAGRLEHAGQAVEVLVAEKPEGAQVAAEKLESINKRRQDITERVVSEAREQALLLGDRQVLLLHHAEWPKGVVGLVAGKIAEEFQKPTFVLEAGEIFATGSARTTGNFDVVECLKSARDVLEKFGGHKQAAGLTVKTENLPLFYEKILVFAQTSGAESLETEIPSWLDAEIAHRELVLETADKLAALEPHGVGNSKPQFFISGLTLLAVRRVGSGGKHAQLTFKTKYGTIDGISFSGGEFWSHIAPGSVVDISAELLVDSWQGRKRVKLRVCDLITNQENPLVRLLPELAISQ